MEMEERMLGGAYGLTTRLPGTVLVSCSTGATGSGCQYANRFFKNDLLVLPKA